MARTLAVGLLFLIAALLASSQQQQQPAAPAQARPLIPDPPYKNLKVLPPDIGKRELVQTMRGFAMQLDVRCSYCHVATDDLSEADFPSDEKPEKAKARLMIRMVEAINRQYLSRLNEMEGEAEGESHAHGEGAHSHAEHEEEHEVTCWTCHRGQTEPTTWSEEQERRKQEKETSDSGR